MMPKEHCCVVMIGTRIDGQGGMSSVVSAYRAGGLFDRYNVIYLSAVTEGSKLKKLMAAIAVSSRFVGVLLSRRIGLVHIHIASRFSFWRKAAFVLLAYGFGKPAILHIHSGAFVEFFATTPVLGQKFIVWLFQRASRVVVLSAGWVDRLAEIVPSSRCVAIENPVMPPSGDPVRKAKDSVTFLFLGRLEKKKGVYDLLPAFARVTRNFPHARLVMGGVGDLTECRQLAIALAIEDKVAFPGWVVGEEKERLLREADVFVLPSHVEGLPISMLEAMSYRLPVVICPVGSIPETIRDHDEALFVPVGDIGSLTAAMSSLAQDASSRVAMGQRGQRTFAARYSAKSVLPRVEALYDEILGR